MRDGRIQSNCTGQTEVAADGGGVGGDTGISPRITWEGTPHFPDVTVPIYGTRHISLDGARRNLQVS